ncbi:MAG: serine hydrolase [Candidatus Omnitrophota bacterium]
MIKKVVVIFLAIGVLTGTGYFSYHAFANFQESQKKQQLALQKKKAAWLALKRYLGREAAHFKGSTGIIVKDLDTGWEFAYRSERLFPSASLVKIPIMAAVFQAEKEGKLALDRIITMKGSDQVMGSGILKAMPAGSQFTVERLLELMVTRSDNTAANMLINLVGRNYLNAYFKRIGLRNTNLSRKMMDFKHRKDGIENYTTPKDVSVLLEKMYKGAFISARVSEKCLALLKLQKVNDRIPRNLPDDVVVAHKTGLERSVCHDAGIVFTEKGDFLICVLTKSKSSYKSCKEFIARIAAYTYHNYKMKGS